MSLSEQYEAERKRAEINIPLTTLAGGAAGAGVGLLGVAPYDEWRTSRIEAALHREREAFMQSQEIWRILHRLHQGKMTWTDLPAEEVEEWRRLYEERKHILSNPNEMLKIFGTKPPGQVVRPAAFQQPLWKRMLPHGDTLRHPLRTALQHPVPVALAALGSVVGSTYAQRKHDHNMATIIESHTQGGVT